jgi:hypothetical protein
VSGFYTFRTECDDGASLYVNDRIVISHKMGATGDNKDTKGESVLK